MVTDAGSVGRSRVLRALPAVLRHLVVPHGVSVIFLLVVTTVSALLGTLIMVVLFPVLTAIGHGVTDLGGTMLGMSPGWVLLWMLFLMVLVSQRDPVSPGADHTTDSPESNCE